MGWYKTHVCFSLQLDHQLIRSPSCLCIKPFSSVLSSLFSSQKFPKALLFLAPALSPATPPRVQALQEHLAWGAGSSRRLQGPAQKSSVRQTSWQKWTLFYSKNLLHLSFLCQQNLDFISPLWESRLRKERAGRKITHSAICMLESLRKRVKGREFGDHCNKEKISLFIHSHYNPLLPTLHSFSF